MTGGAIVRAIPFFTRASRLLTLLTNGSGKAGKNIKSFLSAFTSGKRGGAVALLRNLNLGAMVLGTTFTGLKTLVVGALTAIAGAGWPVAAVMAALAAAALAIWKYWDQLTSILKGIGEGIFDGFRDDIEALQTSWGNLVKGAGEFVAQLGNALGFDGAAIQARFAKAFDFSSMLADLAKTKAAVSDFFSSLFSQSNATDADKANWEALGRRIGEAIAAAIKLPFETLGSFIVDSIKASIDNGWDGLIAYFKGKIAELKNLFKIDLRNPLSGLFGKEDKAAKRPNSEAALAKRAATAKPQKPLSSDATVLGRDFIAGMDKLQKSGALLEKSADSAGNKIETSSRNAGDLLGDRAGAKLRQKATEAGNVFGTAAAAKIAAAAANIKVSASPGRAPGRAKAAALHDGVD